MRWLGLWCITPLSTIFQLYRGGHVDETGENHRPATSHWQTVSHIMFIRPRRHRLDHVELVRCFIQKQELPILRKHLCLPLAVFGGVGYAHIFSFLCHIVRFVCLRPVCIVLNVRCVSGLFVFGLCVLCSMLDVSLDLLSFLLLLLERLFNLQTL